MTIHVDDVKLLKSQRLTDEEDGGGRATGEAVADGEMNNLFPDISRLDRTLGRIALRKVFAGVMTNNAEIGRASCRERVQSQVVGVSVHNKGWRAAKSVRS